jgi:ZIP family zinc transporter
MQLPVSIGAGLWGLLAGGALVLGAAIAWFVHVPQRLIAAVIAFGAAC